MSTALVAFTPTVPFQLTMDGSVYTFLVYFSLYGQRNYIACVTLGGQLVFNLALVGSPLDYDLNLAAGYFINTTLVYRTTQNILEVIN